MNCVGSNKRACGRVKNGRTKDKFSELSGLNWPYFHLGFQGSRSYIGRA